MRIELTSDLTPAQLDQWNQFLSTAKTSHPEQDPRFAPVLRADGHDVVFALGWRDDHLAAVGMFALSPHPLRRGLYRDAMAYSGPICDDPGLMAEFLTGLTATPLMSRIGRLRLTPYWLADDALVITDWLTRNHWKVFEAEPLRQTGLIDITGTESQILARFSQTGRRKIRKAESVGLTVEQNHEPEATADFFARMNEHHAERRIVVFSQDVARTLEREVYAQADLGTALTLRHEGRFVAGILVHRSHHTAHFMHSVSDNDLLKTLDNLRISPFLLLQGMKWANAKGCKVFDLEGYKVGVEPTDRMANIYKYKSEFSPQHVIRVAGHARIMNPVLHLTGNTREIAKRQAKAILARLPRKPAPAEQPAV